MKTPPTDTAVAIARVRSAMLLIVEPGMVVELRILSVVDSPKYPAFTVSGYFDHNHLDELAKAATEWTSKAEGCYVTINAVSPDLLARAANRVIKKPKHTTTDDDIVRRIGLVFDAHPKRPAGVSATDAEKLLAHDRIIALMSDLSVRGWPEAILIDSGNGYHARYKIDLPNDTESLALIVAVLKAASAMFSDDKVTIDTSLSNAARLIKLPGTMARKGDSTDTRPHRRSRVISRPTQYTVVSTELLESFAAEHQPAAHQPTVDTGPVHDPWTMKVGSGDSPEARARAYVFSSGFPDSVAGEQGHGALYRCACELVDGFGLDRNQALLILREWNQAKARPPEEEKQVVHKIDDAIKKHPAPSLKRLNADRHGKHGVAPVAPNRPVDDDTPILAREWPAPPDEEAYQGLAGDIVQTIGPETEADPVAILVQLLVAFGSMIGRFAHAAVGATRHFGNEFVVLVGETSMARKGSSWSEALRVVSGADSDWRDRRILGGLSSGEGLIYAVRDPVEGKDPIKEKGKIIGYQDVILDHGVADKRLLIVETEFGGVLKVLGREGNKLSAVVRQSWDGATLATITKSYPYRATGAHISIIGHITADELISLLTTCDQANGFANRILWVCCRRSKLLPFGGRVSTQDIDRLSRSLADAVSFAKAPITISWSSAAQELWEDAYKRLTSPRPGVLGMVTSRAEAHTLRLSLIYALLDRSAQIQPHHLTAALALWNYCERSAGYIFGNALGDRDAEAMLAALQAAPAGLTRTEIRRGVFADNKPASHIAVKLELLLRLRLVRSESVPTNGRPSERWFAVVHGQNGYVKDVLNVESPPPVDPFHVNHVNHVPPSQKNVVPDREVFEL
jgi:hypothetical protein